MGHHQVSMDLPLKEIFRRSQLWVILLGMSMMVVLLLSVTILSFNAYLHRNVQVLGNTFGELIEPALSFGDDDYIKKSAQSYLQSYAIRKIELRDVHGNLKLSEEAVEGQYSMIQNVIDSYLYYKPMHFDIVYIINEDDNKNTVAKLTLYPNSEQMVVYLVQTLFVLLLSILAMMLCWIYSVHRIYRKIMGVVNPLTQTAELINQHKAYDLRFNQSKISEFNILIQVFNQLLAEIQKWHTSLKRENEELTHQAHHDELTGLPNRYIFYGLMQEIYADENKRQSSVLMFIDNDNFKEINDGYGHQAGDAVLQEMAMRLKARIRQNDVLVRIGGDEFAIILYGIKKAESLQFIAENLLICAQEPLIFEGHKIYFSFSIGMAYSPNAQSIEQWIEQADRAMYQAKKSNLHWVIYSEK